jgi:SAM-dependent methyltransferase
MKNDLENHTPVQPRAGWRQRFFAYMMSKSGHEYDAMVAARKRRLFGDLRGDVLEIGPGTGPNLPYFAPDVHWIGVESNPAMLPYLQQAAHRQGRTSYGTRFEIRLSDAEILPVEDGSMDAVVSTLVLCSVPNPAKTLQEIKRVLKPGGKFVFIEHVAAPHGSSLRRMQGFIRPVWEWQGGGCQPDRETWVAIEQAGFSQVKLEHFRVQVPIVSPQIAGVAIK